MSQNSLSVCLSVFYTVSVHLLVSRAIYQSVFSGSLLKCYVHLTAYVCSVLVYFIYYPIYILSHVWPMYLLIIQ